MGVASCLSVLPAARADVDISLASGALTAGVKESGDGAARVAGPAVNCYSTTGIAHWAVS